MGEAERERLVPMSLGLCATGFQNRSWSAPSDYWKSIDKEPGNKIETAVRKGSS